MRVLAEERILAAVDHPFLANLYGTIQTDTHLHFLMQFCGGGAPNGVTHTKLQFPCVCVCL